MFRKPYTYKIAVFREKDWIGGIKYVAYNGKYRRTDAPNFVGLFEVDAYDPETAKLKAIAKAREAKPQEVPKNKAEIPCVGPYGCGCDGRETE